MSWLRNKLRSWLGINKDAWKGFLFRADGRLEVFKLPMFRKEYWPPHKLKLPALEPGYVKDSSEFIACEKFEEHPLSGYSLEEKVAVYIERKPATDTADKGGGV